LTVPEASFFYSRRRQLAPAEKFAPTKNSRLRQFRAYRRRQLFRRRQLRIKNLALTICIADASKKVVDLTANGRPEIVVFGGLFIFYLFDFILRLPSCRLTLISRVSETLILYILENLFCMK
jgi:hypothetical protein